MSRRPTKRTTTRRTPARPGKKKQTGRARKKQPGLLDKAVAALPLTEAQLRRAASWGIVGVVIAIALGVATWIGLPQRAGVEVAEAVGRAGFRVEQIEVSGLKHMDRMSVYAQALDQESRAMPLVDLDLVRDRLVEYPWISDARVSRRLPDTLMIHIVERKPAAVWQNHSNLMLIDGEGELLEPVSPEAMPDLPLLIGEGANGQEAARERLMLAAPALTRVVKAATWIGNRRWDLIFDTGEKLQLPEGEAAATAALARFAKLDREQRLLGKGYLGFDMRDPSKLIIRRQPASSATPETQALPAVRIAPVAQGERT